MIDLTISAARYGDPEGKSVVITTAERGEIAFTEARAELWSKLQQWIRLGHTIAAYPLDDLKAERLQQVEDRFGVAVSAGMVYGGKVLQIRDKDRSNLDTMGTEARWAKLLNKPWPADMAWRMKDDTFLRIDTADKMIALAEAAMAEFHRLLRVKWAHDDAIKALASAQAIKAYDIGTGW